jgi:hypothetical protein
MNQRPLPVSAVAWVYIAAGAIGFGYHFGDLARNGFTWEAAGVELIRVLAVVCGVFLLRGHNWARWVAVGWMGFHAIVSIFHTWVELAMHCVFLAVIVWVLFRPEADRYFRPARVRS